MNIRLICQQHQHEKKWALSCLVLPRLVFFLVLVLVFVFGFVLVVDLGPCLCPCPYLCPCPCPCPCPCTRLIYNFQDCILYTIPINKCVLILKYLKLLNLALAKLSPDAVTRIGISLSYKFETQSAVE